MNIGTREDLSVLRFRKGGSTCYFTTGILGYAGGTMSISANILYAVPFFVAKTEKFDRIAINVTAAGAAGTKARLGIYADGGTTAPRRLVLDAGEVAVDAIAVVQITISQELIGGNLYWLAIVTNGAPTLRICNVETIYSVFFGLKSSLSTTWNVTVYKSFAYATLPDPFGTPTIDSAIYVSIYLRKV